MITFEVTLAEADLIDRALAMQEFSDRSVTAGGATPPAVYEEAQQRKTICFPLRMKVFQAINQEKERKG